MTQSILSREPDVITAGDTVKFHPGRVSLSDFPIATWTLTYRIVGNDDATATVDATDSDGNYLTTFTKAETAKLAAGDYELIGTITDGTERFTVYTGKIKVVGNFSAADGATDTRSHARKTLEAVKAVLESRATKDQESYTINGRSLNRTPIADLILLRNDYQALVNREEQAERIAKGLGHKGNIFTRFR